MLQKIKNLLKETGMMSIGITLSLVVFVGLSVANGWTEPTVAPPSGNVGAPLNTGALGQSKIGGLVLNTGGAANGLIVQSGNVGIGTITPRGKLDIKDSSMQFIMSGDYGKTTFNDLIHFGGAGANLELYGKSGKDGGGGDQDSLLVFDVNKNIVFRNEETLTNRMNINMTTGNVGIGDATPDAGLKLDVEGKVGATEYCDQNGANCRAAGGIQCVTGSIDKNRVKKVWDQINTSGNTWDSIFNEDQYKGGEDIWGLECKSGWARTGCSAAELGAQGTTMDGDMQMRDNGCKTDNEERLYGRNEVYATCCR